MFCNIFQAELLVYGRPDLELEGVENLEETYLSKAGILNSKPADIIYSPPILEEGDIIANINSFVEVNKADLIAMMPNASRSFIEIFKRNHISLLSFYMHLTLLILQGNEQKNGMAK